MCPLDVEVVEQREEVAAVRELDVVGPRAAEATRVVADHAVVLGEGGDVLVPHAEVRDPGVDERESGSLPLDLIVDAPARDLERPAFGHPCSSCSRSACSSERAAVSWFAAIIASASLATTPAWSM